MINQELKILFVTGEPSGDILAWKLVQELSKSYSLKLFGTGGAKLAEAGQKQLCNVQEMAVIGFDAVIKKIPFLMKLGNRLIAEVEAESPDLVVLVDYAGFNLRFAKKLKKRFPNIPVVGLVAPQVWVWHHSRVKILAKYFDKILCILPFEEELLKKSHVNATYIGNPVVDGIKLKYENRQEFCKELKLDPQKTIVGIIPGSRRKEIDLLMPVFMEAAKKVEAQFVIALADSVEEKEIDKYLTTDKIPVIKGETHDIMKYSDLLWICSGTATLEATILGTPMIIAYNTAWLNFKIIMMLTDLRIVGLPNIIASMTGQSEKNVPIMPELLSSKFFTADNLIKEHHNVMNNIDAYKDQLNKVAELFINQSPMKNAVEEIRKVLSRSASQ